MKKITKRLLATVCALVLVLGSGLSIIGQAYETDANAEKREWVLFSGSKEFEINPAGDLLVYVNDANVTLPDGLKRQDLGLSITIDIPNDDALVSLLKGRVEIAQDTYDEAEISWSLSNQDLKVGENVIELELANAKDSGRSTGLKLEETINWFRIFSTTSSNGSTATLKEAKLVDIRQAGMVFGAEKTYDTYLQLTNALDSIPQSIEASVKMEATPSESTEWVLRPATDTKTNSGQTLQLGATEEGDTPGTRVTYSIWDATSAGTSWMTVNTGLGIDVAEYGRSDLAVSFWVYSNEDGYLTNQGDNQLRLSTHSDGVGRNFIYYKIKNISVKQGWNYVEIPLDADIDNVGWKENGTFDLSAGIQSMGFTNFILDQGSVRYLTDIKLVVLSDENTDTDTDTDTGIEDTGIRWTLRAGNDTTIKSGSALTTGTTTAADAPGAGKVYSIWDATSGAKTWKIDNSGLNIDASAYEASDLAIVFWVYSNEAGYLTNQGDNQLRVSSSDVGIGRNFIYYKMKTIPVVQGWNHIEIPLSDSGWFTVSGQPFDQGNIQRIGFESFILDKGSVRYLTDIELIVLSQEDSGTGSDTDADTDTKVGTWTLRAGNDTTIKSGTALTTGTTTVADAPGVGKTYSIWDATSGAQTWKTDNFDLNIDASAYEASDLAIAFWVYSNEDGYLTNQGDNQLRISSSTVGIGRDFIYYKMKTIPVVKGWNYIEIPLSDSGWFNVSGQIFDKGNIQRIGFESFILDQGSVRYLTDIDLIVLSLKDANTDTDTDTNTTTGSWVLRAGNDTTIKSGSALTIGTTTVADAPGVGKTYSIWNATSGGQTWKTDNFDLDIDASAYEASDLAIAFWVYSNEDGYLTNQGDNQLRISSSTVGIGRDFMYYKMKTIPVVEGWNYIEIPLSDSGWFTVSGQTFDKGNIQRIGFESFILDQGSYRYLTDIELIVLSMKDTDNDDEGAEGDTDINVVVEVAQNVTSTSDNYMIFSNSNAEGETTPYALFITDDGYPAVLWGTTQFTLTQDVRTGEWVDLAVVRDDDGYMSFYVDGAFVAKSDVVAENLGAPNTAHCIGADGSGEQIMEGYIADVRVWSDERTADEILNNRVEKEVGVHGNGLDADTEGLLGGWFLVGDIQNVLEIMPDASANSNAAVYRGSRADDWIDYTIPGEISEDYWSVVFVPDIQNLTRTNEYNKTWEAVAQWIADNVETENIQHVIGAGDTTFNNNETEYNRAVEGFGKFKDLVSTSVLIGNHDYVWNATERDSKMYQTYFGESAIQASAASTTYVGYFDDPAGKTTTENSYYRFSVNGTKWMILQLEFHPRVSVMEWAQKIMEAYPEDNVIVATHSYLDGYGDYTTNTNMAYTSNDANIGGSIGDTTEAIWNEYLNGYTNIKMILCGHSHNRTGSVVERIETNADGETVPVLMINAQDVDAGDGTDLEEAYYTDRPIGMLGILRFSADGQNVALQYYAPTSEKSFSPEDPLGNEDSNNLKYTINVETCSHTNTTISVNDDKATGSTIGYTGDTYCTDCDTMISTGTIITATGEQIKAETEAGKTEMGNTESGVETDSPKTGDVSNSLIWFAVLAGSAVVAYSVKTKYRKEEE